MKTIITLLGIILGLTANAQVVTVSSLDKIPGFEVTRADSFSGKALWGYMDGGADLYMEYGCQQLYVREYTSQGENLKLELYVMGDPAAAFGIYKLSISKCMYLNTITDLSCQSRYQTAAALGPLFLSITSLTGTPLSIDLAGQIARAVLTANPQDRVNIPKVFQVPKIIPYNFNLRFFEGPLGLANGMPQWSQWFQDVSFRMFVEKVPSPDTAAIIARIDFQDNGNLTQFISNAGLSLMDKTTAPSMAFNGMYHSYYQIDDEKILFLETRMPVSLYQYLPQLLQLDKTIWDWENQ